LGLILPDISNPAFSILAHVIETLASKNNYRVMSCNSGEGDHHPESLINSLINYGVDGLIIVPTTRMKPSLFKMIEENEIPFVIADRYLPQVPTYQVTLDNFRLGFDPTEHLIQQGLERIAFFITYPTLNNMKDRLAGYQAAMKKHKKPVNPDFIKNIPFEKEAVQPAVCAAIDDLLALSPPIEGIVFMSNNIGLPALGHLHEKGIKIPENLKIVSEETSLYFSLMRPSISAMNLNLKEMAKKLFEFLMKLIQEEEILSQSVIETIPISIIVRESSTSIS
jgi:LacI family transcriptional regulator